MSHHKIQRLLLCRQTQRLLPHQTLRHPSRPKPPRSLLSNHILPWSLLCHKSLQHPLQHEYAGQLLSLVPQRLFQIQTFSCLAPHLSLSPSPSLQSILRWLIKSRLVNRRLALHRENISLISPTTFLRLTVAICIVDPFHLISRTFCLGAHGLFLQPELKIFVGQALQISKPAHTATHQVKYSAAITSTPYSHQNYRYRG